jgi:HEAT repeat protein
MIRSDTAKLLDDLSKRDTPAAAWPVVERIVASADPALLPEVRRRAEAGELEASARAFVALLSRLEGPDAEVALRSFLRSHDLDAVAAAIRALARYLSPADSSTLAAFIRHEDQSVRIAAIVAAGHARDQSVAGLVAARLDAPSEEERMQAAITLGHLGAQEYALALAERLTKDKGRVFQAVVSALEMLRSRTVLPVLVNALQKATDDQVWDIAHALAVISGVDVAVDPRAAPGRVRKAWLRAAAKDMLATVPAARVANVTRGADGFSSFDVLFGRGDVQIDFDRPEPGTTWPRWGRSLLVRGQQVLDIGSTCGTCESLLRFGAWPAEDVSRLAEILEDRRGEMDLVSCVKSWEPLLCRLRAGRYLAADLTLPVERIDSMRKRDSWFVRRNELRVDDDDAGEAAAPLSDADLFWPGMTHYQGPRESVPPTYPVVLPLTDPGALDTKTVDRFAAAIREGGRPPVVAYTWLDEREVEARWAERFLYLAVLNGHHRLEAYAHTGVPARIVAVARIEDSWGPPDEPATYLEEAFALFKRA